MRKMHKEFQCFLCKERMESVETLRNHIKKQHERNHNCEICKTAFTINELNEHLCGRKKSIRCEYCRKRFTVTVRLLEHLESHERKTFHQCEKCPKFFAMTALKDCHTKTHGKDLPKLFICSICPKAFVNKLGLIKHEKSHDAVKCKTKWVQNAV